MVSGDAFQIEKQKYQSLWKVLSFQKCFDNNSQYWSRVLCMLICLSLLTIDVIDTRGLQVIIQWIWSLPTSKTSIQNLLSVFVDIHKNSFFIK